MTARNFKRGDILFRQGDVSDCVMLVRTGEIEVLREIGTASVVIGHVRDGEWLGEMGVIECRSRSATARAAMDVEVEILTAQRFLEWVSNDAPMARDLIRRLSVRLREVEDKIVGGMAPFVHDWIEGETGGVSDHPAISLTAQTDELRAAMGAATIHIAKLPFLVGRTPMEHEDKPLHEPDLLIDDAEPFRLSRQHFMFARGGDKILVSDLGSALGTIVNGTPIGQHFMRDSVSLRRGENHIVAGGRGSLFAFLVSVH